MAVLCGNASCIVGLIAWKFDGYSDKELWKISEDCAQSDSQQNSLSAGINENSFRGFFTDFLFGT